ncbi:MAG: baseplate J/gp47 family protein [Melioribacteraceae bacterium]|nr:baseplate J/gp47 family protein [Melioribacteraceae bacterium]
MIKTKLQILQDMISDVIAETDKVTYFGKDGVVRGILNAISNAVVEIWADVYQTQRRLHISTATGSDLEDLATRLGMTRLSVVKSSVVLNFNGPDGTVIPLGTIVVSNISGVQYETKAAITLGDNNPNLTRPIFSNSIGDFVIAESIVAGSTSRVNAKELTVLSTPITGVTVINLVPSVGGEDAETDDEFRDRIIKQVDILNQGTSNFYTALARSANANVLKVLPLANVSNGGVDIHLAKNSLAVFTSQELLDIASYIYDRQRSLNTITCYNVTYKSIEVSCFISTKPGSDFESIYSLIATKISDYINLERMSFGATINYYRILEILTDIDDVIDIDANLLQLNGISDDAECASDELPKFSYLSVTNQATAKAENVQQVYQIL